MFYTYNIQVIYILGFVCFIVFVLTFFGFFFLAYNFVFFLILNELMIFSIMVLFLLFGFIQDDLFPQVFVLFILVVSSCEIVVGFALLVSFKRMFSSLNVYKCYYNKKKDGLLK